MEPKPIWVGWIGLLVLWPLASLAGTEGCTRRVGELSATVRAAPDDGLWGTTLEVEISDPLQVLSRLVAPEERPLETCWFGTLEGESAPALVIALGAGPGTAGGVRLYYWKDGHLQATEVPAIPATGTEDQGWSYRLKNRRLEALPRGQAAAAGWFWVPGASDWLRAEAAPPRAGP